MLTSNNDTGVLQEVKNVPKLTFYNVGQWKKAIEQALGAAMVTGYIDGSFQNKRDNFMTVNNHFDLTFAKMMKNDQNARKEQNVPKEEKRSLQDLLTEQGVDSVDIERHEDFLEFGIKICSKKLEWWFSLSTNERMNHESGEKNLYK